jgi:cell division septation protein DedD
MSETLKVELSRPRAIAICVCAAAACVLLFVAGTASGLLLASGTTGLHTTQIASAQPGHASISAEEKIGAAPPAEEDSPANTDSSAGQSSNPPSLAVLSGSREPAATHAVPDAPQAVPAPAPAQPPIAPANPAQRPSAPALVAASSDLVASPSESSMDDDLPLSVRVCSFSGKIAADNLASLLDSRGYHASVTRSFGAQGRVWYVVSVGPYAEWNTAASAAAQVAILANVQPVVAQSH